MDLCIVIPRPLRKEVMTKIHLGHQGIVRCRVHAATSVWWPGSARDMEEFIQSCPECQKNMPPSKEPLLPTELPTHPWERVASDLFVLGISNYLLVADYFSRYVEVQHLTSTTAVNVINALKSRYGVPAVMVSDNGPQYDCADEEIC